MLIRQEELKQKLVDWKQAQPTYYRGMALVCLLMGTILPGCCKFKLFLKFVHFIFYLSLVFHYPLNRSVSKRKNCVSASPNANGMRSCVNSASVPKDMPTWCVRCMCRSLIPSNSVRYEQLVFRQSFVRHIFTRLCVFLYQLAQRVKKLTPSLPEVDPRKADPYRGHPPPAPLRASQSARDSEGAGGAENMAHKKRANSVTPPKPAINYLTELHRQRLAKVWSDST